MVVYVDVLIFLNLFVNFFILQLTGRICRDGCKTGRVILGALGGALFSLYIFLPPSKAIIEILFRLVVSGVIVLIAFGFDSLKSFVRRIGVFFAASFLYAGFMLAIWALLKPQNLAINNGIVYVNISPTVLILATLSSYAILTLIRFLAKKHAAGGTRCEMTVSRGAQTVSCKALVDTGHSLTDSLTGNPVIIIEQSVAEALFSTLPTVESVTAGGAPECGFRMIPYTTVGGRGLLEAFQPDAVTVKIDGTVQTVDRALIAISRERLGEDYKAIISPDMIPK